MDKYIGFDIDSKKTVACVVQKEKKDIYATIGSDVESMKKFLLSQKEADTKIHLTYEISGQPWHWPVDGQTEPNRYVHL